MSGGGTADGDDDVTVATRLEDMVGALHVRRLHVQLRRLKNSNFDDNVILTAIPEYRSKVLFTFQPKPDIDAPEVSADEPRRSESVDEATLADTAGFIMVEAGLEDITLKAAQRKGFQQPEPRDDVITMQTEADETVTMTQEMGESAKASDVRINVEGDDRDAEDKTSVMSHAGSGLSSPSADDEASSQHQVITGIMNTFNLKSRLMFW